MTGNARAGGRTPAQRARNRNPTILDLAAEAGVSKSAVSRALLGQGEVSKETRERVEQAAAKLGYVANAVARGLVRSSTSTIGVVLRDITRPYYAWLYAAMQSRAEEHGYQLVTVTRSAEMEVEDALAALKDLVSRQVDGLVIASARIPSERVVPFVQRVPIVVAGRRETRSGITSVFTDDRFGGRALADHLLGLGHREIAVVLVDRAYSLGQHSRGKAMIDRIRERGADATVWRVPTDTATGEAFANAFVPGAVTAVMCPTDTAMLDALEVLRGRGLSAPADVSVTGYDGLPPLSAGYLGLTTFRQPVLEIGHRAVDLLVDRFTGASASDQRVSLTGSLVEGRTTGPVRRPPRPVRRGASLGA